MTDFVDVEVKILGGKSGTSLHDVEVRVEQSGFWKGQSDFQLDALDPSDPAKYGAALGRQFANDKLLRALDQAGLTRGANIRLRLWLDGDPTALHWVRWERLLLPGSDTPCRLATSTQVSFYRYIPVEQPDREPPEAIFFRLLFAVANPSNQPPQMAIDVEAQVGSFLEAFENEKRDRRLQVTVLPGRTGLSDVLRDRIRKQSWTVIDGSATLQRITSALQDGHHGLHILAHGDFHPPTGTGSLLLESTAGGGQVVNDPEIQAWITPSLQLAVFDSCLTAALPVEGNPPFRGVAPSLIRSGLPAAGAMQDSIAMDDAQVFFSGFYRALLDVGLVDVAVNRGRQLLIQKSVLDSWSIPALYSRLRGGKIWRPDTIRQATLTAFADLGDPKCTQWPPLEVVQHNGGAAKYDPLIGASGPPFEMWDRLVELASTRGEFVILTGAAGSSKGDQLDRLFRWFAEQFRNAKIDIQPVPLTLENLSPRSSKTWPAIDRIWKDRVRQDDLDLIANRRLLFLINAEKELNGPELEDALAAVKRLRDLPGSTVILVADDVLVPALSTFERARLLVVQPLSKRRTAAYLEQLGSKASDNLLQLLHDRGYWDLASQPLFLKHMLDLVQRGRKPKSRREILADLVDSYLARVDTRVLPRCSAENAAGEIAWAIQNGRSGDLSFPDLYAALEKARAGREFQKLDLVHGLIEKCGILTPSGGEGVRFVYKPMQAYFAAWHLAAIPDPDQTRLLEDIAASLGRIARLRRWEKVLVVLASMLPSPSSLLRTVLAGSSLMEGEQLFLAARCYLEARAEHSVPGVEAIIDQIVDSLIWRSSWNPRRSYSDRRKALSHVIDLAAICDDHQEALLGHLVALGFDKKPAPPDSKNISAYDWSGIRQAAVYGLAWLGEPAGSYVVKHRPELVEMLSAWNERKNDPQPLKDILFRNDPSLSVIAAFALARGPEDGEVLLNAYNQSHDRDVTWGIAEALSGLDVNWIHDHVIGPWIEAPLREGPEPDWVRAEHICYLIEKTRLADYRARNYLFRCLRVASPLLQGRALRAFGSLDDPEINYWLRPLCEQILSRTVQPGARPIAIAKDTLDSEEVLRAALEVLRDIGDARSLEAVRGTRRAAGDNDLRPLSFEVGEEVYWRLSGSLDRESLDTAPLQNSLEETSMSTAFTGAPSGMPVPMGVEAATGKTHPPLSESFLDHIAPDSAAALARGQQPKTLAFDWTVQDPTDLTQTGWAVLFASDEDTVVQQKLQPLIDWRQKQVNNDTLFRVFSGNDGVRPGQSAANWAAAKAVSLSAPVTPKKGVPYYVLIVGSPERIPFEFQQQLDLQWAVGRLYFENPQDYADYAAQVIAYEKAQTTPQSRRAAVWMPRNNMDLSTPVMVGTLAPELRGETGDLGATALGQEANFQLSTFVGPNQATKSTLTDIFRGNIPGGPPAVLFTGSHGGEWSMSEPQVQRACQGALVTQSWEGKPFQPDDFFAAADLPADAQVHGLMCFLFACFSGGCPATDSYYYDPDGSPAQIAPKPFIAALPQALLRRGALAVISHVDRSFNSTFQNVAGTPQPQMIRTPLELLMRGKPVGLAADPLNLQWSTLAALLDQTVGGNLSQISKSQATQVANLCVARDEARNYIVLGDPAVRLKLP